MELNFTGKIEVIDARLYFHEDIIIIIIITHCCLLLLGVGFQQLFSILFHILGQSFHFSMKTRKENLWDWTQVILVRSLGSQNR
jgi:hypothetical protein